ncbi:MAG: hypothetical protein MI862_23555 [Desulfobacterales bacterium]|nr:hypothetical protein [Desulfobacterales bacterium]
MADRYDGMRYVRLALCGVTAIFFLIRPVVGYADSSRLEGILSKGMEQAGWLAEEPPFIANDEDAMFMVINGAAPRYMELGTRRAGFVNYEKGNAFLMLEIYETQTLKQAAALFSDFAPGKSIPLSGPGTTARLMEEMGGSLMLEFYQDRFFARLSLTQKTDDARSVLQTFAETLSGRISESQAK